MSEHVLLLITFSGLKCNDACMQKLSHFSHTIICNLENTLHVSYSGKFGSDTFGELSEWMKIYLKRSTKNKSAKITYWMVLVCEFA